MRCMPFPLSLLCHLDNRLGPHSDSISLVCRLHGMGQTIVTRVSLWRPAR